MFESSIEELMHLRRASKVSEYNKQGNPITKRKHLHHLEVVKKKSIYGMWVEPVLFIKAYLHEPGDMSRLAQILDVSSSVHLAEVSYSSLLFDRKVYWLVFKCKLLNHIFHIC